jgi:iron complex outermembrane receptor protein/hemoglobin/transferrin/lactoferrin receptor protein
MISPLLFRSLASTRRLLFLSLLLSCFVVLFADPASAQNRGAVAGQVTTPDGEPLPGVQVVDPALQRGTTTGADGQYTITSLPLGEHLIEFRFV